jgi:hypothetical protein
MADEPTAADLAEGLRNGKWYLWPWEQIGPDSDLDEWKAATVALCEAMGFGVNFIDLKIKSVTVVFNVKAVPHHKAVEDLIMKVDRERSLRKRP